LGAFQCTHSSVVERLIAASFFAIDFSLSWMRRRELSLVDAAADAPDDASGRAMDCSFILSPFDSVHRGARRAPPPPPGGRGRNERVRRHRVVLFRGGGADEVRGIRSR